MFEVLKIYDASKTAILDLLGNEGSPGIRYLGWAPSLAAPKGGGIRQSSSLGWGSSLVQKSWENIVDTFSLKVVGASVDEKIYYVQELRRLLEKAESYWKTSWCLDPVVLEVRGPCETNSRYAIIKAYSTPDDSDPFIQPYEIDDDFTLGIEHTFWFDQEPFDQNCVKLTSHQLHREVGVEFSASPTASTDDCHVNHSTSSIFTVNADMLAGYSLGTLYESGIRLRSVDIPNSATILDARLTIVNSLGIADVGDTALAVQGESNSTPAAFSTYANFTGRTRTTAKTSVTIPEQAVGSKVVIDGLEPIIQEIVNLVGWAPGDNLVLFLQDAGTTETIKRFATYDHVTYNEAILYVLYETAQGDFGAVVSSCNSRYNYISNHHRQAQLTHVFYYDATGGGSYSSNLINTIPAALLPVVPGVGDCLYIMCEGVATNDAHFMSTIFNLSPGASGVNGTWEFSTGGGVWVGLSVTVPYTDTTEGLVNPGTNGVFWGDTNVVTAPWAQDTINGITGYAVRFRVTGVRVTGVSGPPSAPTQVARRVYTDIWPDVKVDNSELLGDLPSRVRTKVSISRIKDIYTPQPHRAIIGTRSLSRGDRFQMCLPAEQFASPGFQDNPFIVPVYPATMTLTAPDLRAPTNKSLLWNPAGASNCDLYWRILPPITNHFVGRYKVFMRLRSGTTHEDNTIQFFSGTTFEHLGGLRDSIYFYGDVKPIVGVQVYYQVVDLGTYDIPPCPIERSGSEPQGLIVGVHIINGAASPSLRLYDLILMPVDEFCCEIYIPKPSVSVDPQGVIGPQDIAVSPPVYGYGLADSIWTKQSILGSILTEEGDTTLNNWRASTPLFNGLQANSNQEQYFLLMEYSPTYLCWYANPFTHVNIQDWALYQYLGMRGAR